MELDSATTDLRSAVCCFHLPAAKELTVSDPRTISVASCHLICHSRGSAIMRRKTHLQFLAGYHRRSVRHNKLTCATEEGCCFSTFFSLSFLTRRGHVALCQATCTSTYMPRAPGLTDTESLTTTRHCFGSTRRSCVLPGAPGLTGTITTSRLSVLILDRQHE